MAIKNGLYSEHDNISGKQLAKLVFHSGLSTSQGISVISWRGVGMDDIRQYIEKLGATVKIKFKAKLTKNTSFVPFESIICIPDKYSTKISSIAR